MSPSVIEITVGISLDGDPISGAVSVGDVTVVVATVDEVIAVEAGVSPPAVSLISDTGTFCADVQAANNKAQHDNVPNRNDKRIVAPSVEQYSILDTHRR